MLALIAIALCAVALPAAASVEADARPCPADGFDVRPVLTEDSAVPTDATFDDALEAVVAGMEEAGSRPIELLPRIPRDQKTRKATIAIMGAYAASFVIMWNLPEDQTNWNKEDMTQRFVDAFGKAPIWDDDDPLVNWVLHPGWGMWVYQTERNYGESMWRSFLVATLHSLFFEYVVEGWTEYPSIQDLISTSPIGSLLGELVHRWILRAGQDGFSKRERILIDLLNPAYRWQIGFDRPVMGRTVDGRR